MGNSESTPDEDNLHAAQEALHAISGVIGDDETGGHDDSVSTEKAAPSSVTEANLVNDTVREDEMEKKQQDEPIEKVNLVSEEVPELVPALPIQTREPESEPFDWDSATVERQAEHYLFLLGMVLAFAELRDGIENDLCTSETLTNLYKGLPSVTTAKDLMDIASQTANEKNVFKDDPQQAERQYPKDMWEQWRSWISDRRGLFSDDVYIHSIKEQNGVLYAICISPRLNSITVVFGYNRKAPSADGTRMKNYEIERNSGRSVGVDASFGDVLAGTRDDDSTLVASILEEISSKKMEPLIRLGVVGYGGGGALASVVGLVLAAAREEPICVWSFGPPAVWSFRAPPVGDSRFQETHERLERRGKLRHVCVESGSSLRDSLAGEHLHVVGVPLALFHEDYYARQRLWNSLVTFFKDETPHKWPLSISDLKECLPIMRAGDDLSLTCLWRRLLEVETTEDSLEEWYENAPVRRQAKRSSVRKQLILLILLLAAIPIGVVHVRMRASSSKDAAVSTRSVLSPATVSEALLSDGDIGSTLEEEVSTDKNESINIQDTPDAIETEREETVAMEDETNVETDAVDEIETEDQGQEEDSSHDSTNDHHAKVQEDSDEVVNPDPTEAVETPVEEQQDESSVDSTGEVPSNVVDVEEASNERDIKAEDTEEPADSDIAASAHESLKEALLQQPQADLHHGWGLKPHGVTSLLRVGMAFSNKLAMLSRASFEAQEQAYNVASFRAYKATAGHVMNSWEAGYWYSKHHARFDALEAVEALHEKLVKDIISK